MRHYIEVPNVLDQVPFEYQTLPPCLRRRYECAVKVSQQWIGLRQAPLLSVSGRWSWITERHIWKQAPKDLQYLGSVTLEIRQ